MKKMKFVVVTLMVAISVTAAFAFSGSASIKVKKAATTTSWFEYNPQFEGGTENPQNYEIIGGEPECTGNGDLCAIEADVMSGDLPDLDHVYGERKKP